MVSFISKNKQILMICIFLTVATLTAYWQVGNCEFTNYDDEDYVTKNSHVQDGITLEGIQWAFTTGHSMNWHPLTWISHMLDVQLFGLQPRWHHLTNLLFHLANTLLLFFVLHRMTKARWKSAFVAALFALHPLHVQTVAWVAERKDVLSAFFWMLTMAAYCFYVECPKLQRYLLVAIFFVLGLMAKPMLVTLPFVLLLLDYWPLQRFRKMLLDQKISITTTMPVTRDEQQGISSEKPAEGQAILSEKPVDAGSQWALMRPLLWEKIPLFGLAALASLVTYIVQQKGGAVVSFEKSPLGVRIANTFVSYITYMGKTIWPVDLVVFYPRLALLPTEQVVGAAFLLIAVTITVIAKAGRIPYAMVGWLWYIGTLIPVIGIVQVGLQASADRYTYLPLIGLFIMAAWGIPELIKNWRFKKEVLFTSSMVVLLCFYIVTWTQVLYWQNSISLYDHALNVTENNYIIYCNRGLTYMDLRDYRRAITDFDKAIEINPKFKQAYNHRGLAYTTLRNYRQAIMDFDKAIEIDPKFSEVYINRGYAHKLLGDDRQAIEDLKIASRLGQKNAQDFLKNRGIAW